MMKTVNFKITALVGLLLSLIATMQSFAQQEAQVEVTPLRSSVYMLKGQGGNIGVSVGDDGVFMIDDQYAPMTDKIRAAIKTLSDKPVKFVINTHWHGDHTGGNENFATSGSVIVAHENVRKRLSTDQVMQAFKREVKASPDIALPVVTFTEQVGFHLNDDYIQALHVKNAHTDGDAIIHFENANVIHMGDTFFNGTYPFIDVSAGGSLNGVLTAAKRGLALANEETLIIPGHGPLSNKAELQTYLNVLTDINDQFTALRKSGTSAEDILAEGISMDYDEDWGQGFIGPEKFIEILNSQPVESSMKKKIIEPTNRNLHEHGAQQKATVH